MRVCTMKVRALATVVLLCGFGLAAQPTQAQQTFSFSNFNSTTGLTLKGSTASVLNGNANVLRITPAQVNSVGSTWYSTTLPLQAGFTTTFTFQFSQQGGTSGHADGIAFVVQGSTTGNQYLDTIAGGSVGYGDDDGDTTKGAGISNSLAFEFDTFQNPWDQNNNHVAIQSCGSGNNNQHHVSSTCLSGRTGSNPTIAINNALSSLNIDINDGQQHTAVITYSPPSSGVNNLTVTLDGKSVLVAVFDITSLGLDANADAYVGFTASTGGGFENQDIVSWSFSSQTITQPVSTSQPTTFSFNNNEGTELVHAVDFSTAAGNLTYPLSDPNTIVIQSTNNSVDAATWPQYVHGGPFATSFLFPLVDDNTPGGAGTNGGLFVDLCFDPTLTNNPQAQTPSDANCPSVSTGSTNFLGVDVTADLVSKPPITPGTISVLAHYEPPSATPLLPWSPTAVNATANPGCVTTTGSSTNPQPAPPANCDTLDVEQAISGDQTTSSGRVRNKGTFAFAYNVPMLESTVSVNGTQVNQPGLNNPSSSAALWFSAQNAPLNLSFLVNPACPPGSATCPPAPTAANFYFQAAPVASESFAVTQANNTVVPTTAATPPIGFNTATVQPITFKGLVNGGSVPNGTYLLQWAATDNVGIPEQFQQLTPFTGSAAGTCSDGSPVAPGGACYNTSSFAATLNVDSTSPTISVTSPTNTTYTAGQKVAAKYTCSDPTPGAGVAGGATGCQGPVANNTNIDTTPNGAGTTNKTFTVTSADAAIPANTASKSVSYSVTCHYAALSVSPNNVKRPALIGVTASVADCMPTAQNVSVKFTLSGPLGRNCSNDSTVMFTTPTFTIKAGASNAITFPFIIPGSVCAGTYTISTTTIQSGTPVDTSTTTLTVR
jgi:hypothetical protein